MPRFGLLPMLVPLPLGMLSEAMTDRENTPVIMENIFYFSLRRFRQFLK
jgi:hypothetical protein